MPPDQRVCLGEEGAPLHTQCNVRMDGVVVVGRGGVFVMYERLVDQ